MLTRDRLGTISRAELAEDPVDVDLDGADGEDRPKCQRIGRDDKKGDEGEARKLMYHDVI